MERLESFLKTFRVESGLSDPQLLGLVLACILCSDATIGRVQDIVEVYPSIISGDLKD